MEIVSSLFDKIFYSFWTWLGTFLIIAVFSAGIGNMFTKTTNYFSDKK